MKTYEERQTDILYRVQVRKRIRRRVVTLSCMTLLLVTALLVLFVPYSTQPPSVQRYANSPYYHVIQALNRYFYQPPVYRNNYEALMGELKRVSLKGESMGDGNPPLNEAPSSDIPNNNNYVEVTDNQIQGVIEPDLFKRTQQHIFRLRDQMLYVYTIEKENSRQICAYSMGSLFWDHQKNRPFPICEGRELFLSPDGKTLTALFFVAEQKGEIYTAVINLDVSDPTAPRPVGKLLLKGGYDSARMVDGRLLVTGSYQIHDVDFSQPETYLPAYGWPGNMTYFDAADIQVPDKTGGSHYMIYSLLDASTLQMLSCKALLDYSGVMLVTGEHIFATRYYRCESKDGLANMQTDITAISYQNGVLEPLATITVDGRIRNQYSMDVYNGSLRVVTTTSTTRPFTLNSGRDGWSISVKSADLYCFDMVSWTLQGMVQSFAPQGEEVVSVRFDGDRAYACAAKIIQVTDPVYFFDLTDPGNIIYTDTGTIDGFSSSLVELNNGDLLGIGVNENRELKVEVYRKGEGKVDSVCSYEIPGGSFANEYKAYLIDRENNLFGLAVLESGMHYLLLHYDGTQLQSVVWEPIDTRNPKDVRAIYIDSWLYILHDGLSVLEPHWNNEEPKV